jgi:hypothetical protein
MIWMVCEIRQGIMSKKVAEGKKRDFTIGQTKLPGEWVLDCIN